MNTQAIFDKVASHLVTQNRRSRKEFVGCAYRGDGGLQCAIGCLIADEFYRKYIEGKSVYSASVTKAISASIGRPLLDSEEYMLAELQNIHDCVKTSLWSEQMVEVASNLGLNHTVLNDNTKSGGETMKQRIKKNTSELYIGDMFYDIATGGPQFIVKAIGPEYCLYKSIGYINWCIHCDVWVDAPPRAKVGQFAVGEMFKLPVGVYEVTAIGREYSLAVNANGKGHEIAVQHCLIVEEVPNALVAEWDEAP